MQEGHVGKMLFSRILEGEDLIKAIKKRAEESGVKAGIVILIGSLKNAILGYYKDEQYKQIQLNGPLEIASGIGNIAISKEDEVMIHVHLVVSSENGEAFGGHLMEGSIVGATAELVIIEGAEIKLQRTFDERTKLNLWKLG